MSTGNASRQRLEVLRIPINKKLELLGNEALIRSHSSVNLSFDQMLAYIDRILEPRDLSGGKSVENLPKEINLLLQTYQDMAQRFYTKYELTLLKEIDKQQILREQIPSIVLQLQSELERETDETKCDAITIVIDFLKGNIETTKGEHSELLGDFSTQMQMALDRLKDEWYRVQNIVTASQSLNKDDKLLRALDIVVDAAAYTVGINTGRILVIPGSAFALYFFAYLENFAVLTVPIYSIRAPWEWSIFWHEAAGYQVRQLQKSSTIESMQANLIEFHKRYQTLTSDEERDELLNKVTRNQIYENAPGQNDESLKDHLSKRKNLFTLNYLKELFSNPEELDLRDLGGLDYQFEQILLKLNIPKRDRLQVYEENKKIGWSVDWIKELFEDAWSVLAIREPFLDFFEDVLSRHNISDGRHPDHDIRIKTAKELLRLLNEGTGSEKSSDLVKVVAKQILSLISLMMAASYQFEKDNDPDFNIRQETRNSLPEIVGALIGDSIGEWSKRSIQTKGRSSTAESEAEDLIETLSDEELTKFINILNIQEDNIDPSIQPSIDKLLEGKDFKQLLDLPFFERDFLNANKIRNVRFGFGIRPRTQFLSVAGNVNFILPWNVLLPGSGGDVSFDIDGQTYHTTKLNWNQAFNLHQDYTVL